MRRHWQSIPVLLFLCSIWSPLAWSQDIQGPKMVLKEQIFDFKEVWEGEVIEHTFQAFNQGDQTLEIKDVIPSWGCASAQFDRAIPPGGEGNIIFIYRTKGHEGPLHKDARVYTNDPAKKEAIIEIKAFIKTPVHVSSRFVTLHSMEGQSATRVVDVRAELDRPLELTPTKFNLAEKLTYTIEEIEKGRHFQIRFTTLPGPPQTYRGYLKLKTNYQETPKITIRISGLIKEKS